MRTIDSHEQQKLGLDDMDQFIQVVENFQGHLCLCELATWVVPMGTVVYDSVHIKVQVVHNGHACARNRLVDKRIALAQPAIKLGNPCSIMRSLSVRWTNSGFVAGLPARRIHCARDVQWEVG